METSSLQSTVSPEAPPTPEDVEAFLHEKNLNFVSGIWPMNPEAPSSGDVEAFLHEKNLDFVSGVWPTVFYITLLSAIGLVGNTVVFFVYYRRFKPSATRTFILAMSVCDLLTNVLSLPTDIVELRFRANFRAGWACKVIRTTRSVLILFSTCILVAVAVNRQQTLCKMRKAGGSVKKAYWALVASGALSVLSSVPYGVLTGPNTLAYPDSNITGTYCTVGDRYYRSAFHFGYNCALAVTFIGCLAVMVVSYGRIAHHLWRHNRSLASTQLRASQSHQEGSLRPSQNAASSETPATFRDQRGENASASVASEASGMKLPATFRDQGGENARASVVSEGGGMKPQDFESRCSVSAAVVSVPPQGSNPEQPEENEEATQEENQMAPTNPTRPLASVEKSTAHGSNPEQPATDNVSCGSAPLSPTRPTTFTFMTKKKKMRMTERQISQDKCSTTPSPSANLPFLVQKTTIPAGRISRNGRPTNSETPSPTAFSFLTKKRAAPTRVTSQDKCSTTPDTPSSSSNTFFLPKKGKISKRVNSQERSSTTSTSADFSDLMRRVFGRETSGGQQVATPTKHNVTSVRKIPHRTTYMMFVLTVVFVLNFLPYLVITIGEDVQHDVWVERWSPNNLYMISLRSFYINSAVNPIVFWFCCERFRQECRALLGCK